MAVTVHRSEKNRENPYAQISRKMAQDSSLSFQARGLMLYILSKPPKWKGKTADLQREGNIKAKALKTILDELIAKGYIAREEDRKRGRFDYKLEVFEEPELNTRAIEPEECLTVPPSRGVGADAPSRLPREVGSVINSTHAGAFSSVENKEQERTAVRDKPRRKEPPIPPPFHGQSFLIALGEFEVSQKEMQCPIGLTRRKKLYEKLEVFGEIVATYELNRAVEGGWKSVHRDLRATNGNGHYSNSAEPPRQRTQYEILKEQGKI